MIATRCVVGSLIVWACMGAAEAADHAVEVTASSLNVRTAAWGTVLGTVDRGDTFVVQEQRDGWLRVNYRGRSAWFAANFARRLSSTEAVVVTASALNVRTSASANGTRMGVVADGQAYTLLSRSGSWRLIQYDHRAGWVHGSFTRELSVGSGSSSGGSSGGSTGGSTGGSVIGGGVRHAPMQVSDYQLEVLARICKGEAGVTSYLGKVAVCAVVLNRVRNSRWPNTIAGVVHQPWQFSAYNPDVRNRLYWGPIPDSCWRAAREALAGADPTYNSDHYFNPFLVLPSWAKRLDFVRRIGSTARDAHDFYRTR